MSFAAIGSAAGSALVTGGINKLFGGSKGGGSGFDIVQSPFQDQAGQAINFNLDQLQSLQSGQLPSYFTQLIPELRGYQDASLRNTFFGQPGRRGEGLVSQAVSLGSLTGAGPRSSVAQGNKQLQNFGLQSQAIDQFISQQGVDIARETALNAPRNIASLTSATRPQLVPFNQPATGGGLDFGDDFSSALTGGFSSLIGGLKKKKNPLTYAGISDDQNPFTAFGGLQPFSSPPAISSFKQFG